MSKSGCVGLGGCVWVWPIRGAETLRQLIKGKRLCPNLETISVLRNVLHHNNGNVGRTGNTWLTTLYNDLLSVWQSALQMMFGSHKQFQHGRVRCQDNSYIIRHSWTSTPLAKKIRAFYLASLVGPCFLVIVSHQQAVLSFGTWPSPPPLCHARLSREELCEGSAWGTGEGGEEEIVRHRGTMRRGETQK